VTAEERERIIELINHPPTGSKIADAKRYGIDLTLLIRRLELSPSARLEELESAQQFLAKFRAAAREHR
jgi:hypothetical protein